MENKKLVSVNIAKYMKENRFIFKRIHLDSSDMLYLEKLNKYISFNEAINNKSINLKDILYIPSLENC